MVLISTSSPAADKNGVSPNTISLPSGPGSIEGLGGAFQPMLNTGMAKYEVEIALPAGVNGYTPKLSLSYDSGLGDGPAGIGWTFGPGSIKRQTEKGIPRYVDNPNGMDDDHDGEYDEADEENRFIGIEGEELVRLADSTYRARIEGAFIRYRRIEDHWEAHLKDGTKLEFGLTPAGRVTDGGGNKVYRWLLEKSTNTNGNVIIYIYTSFSGSENQRYLNEIRYGPGSGPWEAFYFASLTYEDRPDWRKDYRSGFKIKTAKKLARIDIGVQGVNPAQCAEGDWNHDGESDNLIRRYTLSYNENNAHWSYLSKVTQYGSDGINYLPPLSFSYSTFDPQPSVSAQGAMIDSENEPFSVMDSQLVELIDLNRDGLPDLLKTDIYGGGHTGYLNMGMYEEGNRRTVKWASGQKVASEDGRASVLHLSENQVHLADMDGDGISDIVHTTPIGDVYYYLNQGDVSWRGRRQMSIQDTAPPAPFGSKWIKTSDLDFDKRIDVVKTSENGYSIWFNLGEGKYSREVRTLGARHQGRGILFSENGVHLADMNGDRMNDVVKITPIQVIYCANMGHGNFDTSVAISIPGQILTDGPNGQIAKSKLQDVNGDGLADLVIERAGPNELWYWLNQGTDILSAKHIITHMQLNFGSNMVTRWADLNGNGTTDLIYADSSAISRLRTLDIGELVGGSAHPNMLTEIDNGLGVITRIIYRSSTEYYLQALEEGDPWSTTLPSPVTVVARVETTPSLDLDDIPGEDIYVKEYIYRDGYYDDIEKTFRGFAEATVLEHGDISAPTQVTKSYFFTGGPDGIDNDEDGVVDEISPQGYREDEPLKGMARAVEVMSEDDFLYSREEKNMLIRTLLINPEDIEVQFACNQETNKLVYEGTESPETIKTTYAYDDFGNVIEEKNYGALSISGDEVFTYTIYINDTEKWTLGLVSQQYITDSNGQKVAETFSYYDGPAYEGLALGLAEKGNLSREEVWVEDTKYVNLARNVFDAYGNIINTKDANGNIREIEYDPVFHIFPITESIYIDKIQKLTMAADYNLGLSVLQQSTDYNGHITAYTYDSFGRLTRIVRPGDTLTYPSQSFIYTMADPYRGLIYSYDEEGTLTLTSTGARPNSVITRIRENFGMPDTFDSIQYTDGLGRKLAIVEEAEEGFIVKEAVLFNAKGISHYGLLPYIASSSDYHAPSLSNAGIETHYDATEREIVRINPPDQDNVITQASIHYTPLQNTVTDENGNTKIFINDGLDRLIEVHEHNMSETFITSYEYDALGNLIQIIDAQNNIKTMYYDGLQRTIEQQCPNRGQMLYEYDDIGNLIKTTDNKGQVILYTYDGANRILTEDYLDQAGITPDVAFHYDFASSDYPEVTNLKGRLSWIEDLSGINFFSYDQKDNTEWTVKRIDQGSVSKDYKTVMTYDAIDRPVTETYPDDYVVNYKYNNRTLLESIPGLIEDIDYTPDGQLEYITYANGIEFNYAYDPRRRLIHFETKNIPKGNEILQHLSYTWDGVSNIVAMTDGRNLPANSPQNASQIFKYDDLNRLSQSEGLGYGIINFQYDKIGNMIWKKSPDAPDPKHIDNPSINLGSMSYGGTGGSANRSTRLPGNPPGPQAITSTESGLQYDYDDNGNMIGNANGDQYLWDFRDRLIRVQKDGIDTHYVYDHAGQRIIKKVNEGAEEKITFYISKGYELHGGKAIRYVIASKKRIARIESEIAGLDSQAQQALVFQPGWNFFSLKVEPENPAIEIILGPIEGNFSEVWTFDAIYDQYKGYVPNKGIYDLTELQTRKGYLIKVSTSTSLVITGIETGEDITLSKGWNLIACPANTDLPIEEALSSITGKLASIWSYETINHNWICFAPTEPSYLNDLERMEPGKSYWVLMQTEGHLAYVNKAIKKTYFYHPDHLGSSNLITDMDGTVVESTEFYPFGLTRYEHGYSPHSRYKFTGQERDAESGLDYFGARYYLPVVGRFISVDPVEGNWNDPQSCNRYAYSRNNPLKYIDPDGNKIELHDDLNEQERQTILFNLQKLTGDKLFLVEKDGSWEVRIKSLGKKEDVGKKWQGTRLIREIRWSEHVATIKIGSENAVPVGSYNEILASMEGRGSSADIEFNPTSNPFIRTKDPVTGNVIRQQGRPPQIGLAHELIHVHHIFKGTHTGKEKITYGYKTASGILTQEVEKDELRTIGLLYNEKGDITENMIRREQGVYDRGAF